MGKKSKNSTGKQPGVEPEIRIDKWLKVARIFKTRTLAQEAISAGHVKSGTHSVKPGRDVKIGDEFSVTKGRRRLRIKVLVVTSRSVSAKDSHDLYQLLEDHTEKDQNRELNKMLDQVEDSRRHRGRPTKRERRQIEKYKKGD
jgi:ribosome-associated heat shock protein Hsp15